MYVCQSCHPQPSKEPGGDLAWVEELLKQANAHPINTDFTG